MDVANLVPTAVVRPVTRFAAIPLLHFFLIGGLLYAAQSFAVSQGWFSAQREVIRVSASDVERLRSNWIRESGRVPTQRELSASLDSYVDDEVLLREAFRLGLDRKDPVVRERLLLNMRFAFPQSRDSAEQLLREAQAMRMQSSDVVVRRRLIQLMEQRVTQSVHITDADLRGYIDRHPERYAARMRVGFRQIFLSDDVHRENPEWTARQLLAQLQEMPSSSAGDATRMPGDPFLLGENFPPSTQDEIARIFGEDFARMAMTANAGNWVGPVRSPYGLHLIRVEPREAIASADFSRIRSQVAYALQPEMEQRALHEQLARLRRHYKIEVEQPVIGQGAAETAASTSS